MIKYITILYLLVAAFSSCKNASEETSSEKPESTKPKREHLEKRRDSIIHDELKKPFENGELGVWHCYRFEKDILEKAPFSRAYAQEYSKRARFSIHSDSIHVFGNPGQPVYTYRHASSDKGHGDERPFILKFSPKADSLDFCAQYNGSIRLEPFTLLFKHGKDLVIRDRGYFFFFRLTTQLKDDNLVQYGNPPDSRNYFKIEERWNDLNLREAYNRFKKSYPFGAENLLSELPKTAHFDKANDVNYEVSLSEVHISKRDPNGTLLIDFWMVKDVVKLRYQIEYLDY